MRKKLFLACGEGGRRRRLAGAALLAAACAALSACSSATDAAGQSSAPTASIPSNSVDPALHDLLPDAIKSSGVLRFGTTTGNAPMDFATDSGEPQGVDIDLARAAGQLLGVKVEFTETQFSGLIAGELANRFDAIWGAMNDTPLREQQVTFVNYFKHGFSVLVPHGNPHKVASQADFCGLSFGEAQGSYFQTYVPTISQTECVAKGKQPIKVSIFPDNAGTYQALSTNRVDIVMAAQEQVTYEANLNQQLQPIPQININPVQYGIGITPSNTALIKAIQGALKEMVSNGSYQAIVHKWKLDAQAITEITINKSTA